MKAPICASSATDLRLRCLVTRDFVTRARSVIVQLRSSPLVTPIHPRRAVDPTLR